MSGLFKPDNDRIRNNPVAIRTPSPVSKEIFFACKACFRLFRSYDLAIEHFRTSPIHADELHLAIQNMDDDDDESIDIAAATMITEMMVAPELLPESYSSGLKHKAVFAAPVKKPRLDIDYEDNRSSGLKLKAVPAIFAAPLKKSRLDIDYEDNRSSGLKRKAVPAVIAAPVKKPRLDIDYQDNRKIQNVITGYNGAELTAACKAMNNGPATTLDGATLDKAAVTGLRYTDNRMVQNVFTK